MFGKTDPFMAGLLRVLLLTINNLFALTSSEEAIFLFNSLNWPNDDT